MLPMSLQRSGNLNLILHPGYFPDTAEKVSNEKFALVNLDADLYQPTKAALEFFYPRLSPGALSSFTIIIINGKG